MTPRERLRTAIRWHESEIDLHTWLLAKAAVPGDRIIHRDHITDNAVRAAIYRDALAKFDADRRAA